MPPGDTKTVQDDLLKLVLWLMEGNPHSFSASHCKTCPVISKIAGEPFGCVRLSVEALATIDNDTVVFRLSKTTARELLKQLEDEANIAGPGADSPKDDLVRALRAAGVRP